MYCILEIQINLTLLSGQQFFGRKSTLFHNFESVFIKGGDHCKKSVKSIFSFLHFLKNVRFKNALSKFYEEIRKIDEDIATINFLNLLVDMIIINVMVNYPLSWFQ